MENTEVVPDPALNRVPDTDVRPKAEIQEFDRYSAIPAPENRKFKGAAPGCGLKAGDVCDTDYYYG